MANNYFQFKQFRINQDKCSMKVGTDGVLLGAWTNVANAKTILDVGTGTGLIALMLAQRSPKSRITALEIESAACQQAEENVESSAFKNQIKVIHEDFKNMSSNETFDLIVSNPPFFDNGTVSDIDHRSIARHQVSLTFTMLIDKSVKLLNPKGSISLILPLDNLSTVTEIIKEKNLHLHRVCRVHPTPNKPAKRVLLECGNFKSEFEESSITLEKSRHQYTEDAQVYLKDFYLNL